MGRLFYCFALCLILTGCNYHLGVGDNNSFPTLSVDYVEGDFEGCFTEELVKQITTYGSFRYAYVNSDIALRAKITDISNNQIGYKRDVGNDGKLKEYLMPTEGRQSITVKVSLVSQSSGEVLWGPNTITADVDYDYVNQDSLNDLSFFNNSNNRTTVLSFSLGQLESIESAKHAALTPLFRKVAQKIVDVISAEW